ncbi:MAG: bifunctional glutamate N-acetyltransferase/amino-acid acetyltransferase ArgJ [Gammaproteobacteria bacterium]
MAVGLSALPTLAAVPGIRLSTVCAGIKKPGRRDLVVVELEEGTRCAAVFTRNAFCAAPVGLAKRHLMQQAPRYLLINTGNANAGTGARGWSDALACCQALAESAGVAAERVLPFSTGVIGEPLPVETIVNALPAAFGALSAEGWDDAAHGIMTTDTVAKGLSRQIQVAGQAVTVTGIAKGAGMIRPDMATMLAFVATDAKLSERLLQQCLEAAVQASFNCITVDGDTSTNDACILMATGRSAAPEIVADDPAYAVLSQAITEVCVGLAQAIVRDGEGATKFITVEVKGGVDEEESRRAAYAIAHSPLVKTAFFASDPNWGRILAAVGRAGIVGMDVERVNIFLDDVCIVANGERAPDYREEQGREVMAEEEIIVRIELGRGKDDARVWTCDLSYDYVRINAEYRT